MADIDLQQEAFSFLTRSSKTQLHVVEQEISMSATKEMLLQDIAYLQNQNAELAKQYRAMSIELRNIPSKMVQKSQEQLNEITKELAQLRRTKFNQVKDALTTELKQNKAVCERISSLVAKLTDEYNEKQKKYEEIVASDIYNKCINNENSIQALTTYLTELEKSEVRDLKEIQRAITDESVFVAHLVQNKLDPLKRKIIQLQKTKQEKQILLNRLKKLNYSKQPQQNTPISEPKQISKLNGRTPYPKRNPRKVLRVTKSTSIPSPRRFL